MRPIFHLAFPVSDLAEAERFYVTNLGAIVGRRTAAWIDLLLFGHQLTIHERPEEVLGPEARGVRHFGLILASDDWHALAESLSAKRVAFVRGPSIEHQGTVLEEGKILLADPSGNLIELKTYRNFEAVFASDRGRECA
jgi:extradiol dioxygenase family protein